MAGEARQILAPQGHFTTGTRISNPSLHVVQSKKLAHAFGLTVAQLLSYPKSTPEERLLTAVLASDDDSGET